jgi:purine-binding chemotaxis protein CheW
VSTDIRHQLVTFRLGEDHFAADVFGVERVLRFQEPTPVPDVPPWIVGVIEYQGRIVPVIDLRRRFELEDAGPGMTTRILIFATDAEWVGAVVDAVLEVVTVTGAQLAPPPALFRGLSAEYVRGIVRRDGRLIVYLDVARLLTATERLTLRQVTGEQQMVNA